MTKYEIDHNYDLYKLINILKKSDDADVLFFFEESSPVYRNSSNLMALKKIAFENGKSLLLDVQNPTHRDYIQSVNSGTLDFGGEIELGDDSLNNSPRLNLHNPNKKAFKMPTFGVGALRSLDNPLKYFSLGGGLVKWIVIVLVLMAFLASSAYGFVYYVPSANVKVKVNSEVLVKILDVKATTDTQEVSIDNATIPAFSVSVIETDSQTVPTSGKKDVGEKATGSIVLTNKTDKDIELKKGTVFSLDEKDSTLKFLTTQDVKISKYEEKVTPTEDGEVTEKVFGKKEVKVEAETFGAEYNLGKGKKFKTDKHKTDQLSAENEENISGGTKEEVQIITQADMDNLLKTTDEFMKNKVKDSLNKKILETQSLPETSIDYKQNKAEFNGKLDDVANELSLTMTYEGTGLAYNKSDMDQVVKELAKKVVPETFDLNDDFAPEYDAVGLKDLANPNTLNVQIMLRSYILPKLNIEDIRNQVSGRKISDAQEYLQKLPNVNEIVIEVSPQLPEFLLTMPRNPEKIKIEILK